MASGADAVIVDLEDSIAPERKAAARKSAAAFLKDAVDAGQAPSPAGARQRARRPASTDADLDAVVPARPDAIMLPKAEGGAAVIHADAKLAAREAIAGLPDGHIKIVAHRDRDRGGAVSRRHLSRRERAARRPDLGRGGPLGRARRRGQPRRGRPLSLDPIGWRARSASPARPPRSVQAIDTVYVGFPQHRGAAARDRGGAPRRLHRARWRSIRRRCRSSTRCSRRPPEAIAKAQRGRRGLRGQPGAGVVGIDGVMYDRPHLERARQLIARANAAGV